MLKLAENIIKPSDIIISEDLYKFKNKDMNFYFYTQLIARQMADSLKLMYNVEYMVRKKLDIFIDSKDAKKYLNERDGHNYFYEMEDGKIYDAAIIINTPSKKMKIRVKKGNALCLIGEPSYKANFLYGYNLYMYKGLSQYDKVFSIIKNASNVVETQPYLGWFEDKYSYRDWESLGFPEKTKTVSCISSDKLTTKGHEERFFFVEKLKEKNIGIDFYGRGYKEIEDKHKGLRDYKYSIAIENGSFKNYFSEKIMDCFLNYTVPIYYGCPNIEDFFPKDSYISIDINDKDLSLEKIEDIIVRDKYESRISALKKARDLVLEKYNIYSLIRENENYFLSNMNNPYKIYKLRPIFSLGAKFKARLFPISKPVRTFFIKNIFH